MADRSKPARPPARPRPPPRPPRPSQAKTGERAFITPEGVDLKLQLADIGERAGAFILDLLVMFGLLVGMTLLALLAGKAFGYGAWEFLAIVWLLGFFLIRNFYFILFESRARAATLGKRMLGLRVVARDGGSLTIDAVIARNMLREIEIYLPLSFLGYQISEGSAGALITVFGLLWSGVFLLFPLFNKDRLRAGDLIAGTWVIKAPKRQLALDLLKTSARPTDPYAFTDAQLNAYGIYELQTLESILRRKDAAAMKTVADSIRKKIGWPTGRDDFEFLSAYYAKLRARLERGLLFGQRRADKHDRK